MKKKKNQILLDFSSVVIMDAMYSFFNQHNSQISSYLKGILEQNKNEKGEPSPIHSDPSMFIKDGLIVFKDVSTDKGACLVLAENGEFVTKDYKLIADGESYLFFDSGALQIFFKRIKGADDLLGHYANMEQAKTGLPRIDDPLIVQARADAIDKKQENQLEEMKAEMELSKK